MAVNGFMQCLITAQTDGTANTTGAAASLLPAAARYALPPNFFYIGKQLLVKASGRISTAVTTPGNLTWDFRLGTTGASIVVFGPAATAGNIVVQTNQTWDLEILFTCRAIGSGTSANGIGTGKLITRAALNAPAAATTIGVGTVLLPDTAPVVGTGFDSTIVNYADLFFTNSVATGSCLLHQYSLYDVS
jgi:hypothetical protein